MYIKVLIISILLLLSSCDFSLGEKTLSAIFPGDGFTGTDNTGNLTPYSPVSVDELLEEGNTPIDIGTSDETSRIMNAASDVLAVLNADFFINIAEGLGFSEEDFFGYEHIKPRTVSSSFEFHAVDEGIKIINGQNTIYSVNVNHLDFIASLECQDFVRFFLNYIVGGKYNYSYNYIKADGKIDLSFRLSSFGENLPTMLLSGLVNVSAKDLMLEEYNFNGVNGIGKILLPIKGGLKIGGVVSFGKSGFMVNVDVPDYSGFPALDDQAFEQEYIYHPYSVTLFVRESVLVDCAVLYKDIVNIIKSGSSLISEDLYNTIASALWPEHDNGNIVLSVKYADGNECIISDWTLFQFIFAN